MSSLVGWCGTIAILAGYLLLTTNKLNAGSKIYQLLNLLGAIGILINTVVNKAWPAAALNLVWAIIAIYGLVKKRQEVV